MLEFVCLFALTMTGEMNPSKSLALFWNKISHVPDRWPEILQQSQNSVGNQTIEFEVQVLVPKLHYFLLDLPNLYLMVFLPFLPQTLTKLIETPDLSVPCYDTLLKVFSVLLLDKNAFLPDPLVKEIVKKVKKTEFGLGLNYIIKSLIYCRQGFKR